MKAAARRAAVPVVVVLVASCGGGDADGAPGDPAPGQIQLVMVDNAFEPSRWRIPAGGASVSVTNDGAALHNLTIEEAGIDEDVPAGDGIEVEIDLDPGEYEMVCVYHVAQGMTGTVVAG